MDAGYLAQVNQCMGIPIDKIVKKGKVNSVYEVFLQDGTVIKIQNYTKFTSLHVWKQVAFEYGGAEIRMNKSQWENCNIIHSLLRACTCEE